MFSCISRFLKAMSTACCASRDVQDASNDRSERVRRLLVAVVILSLMDLAATLVCMKTIGMYEANPIVRQLAGLPFPATAISLFKMATLAAAIAPVYSLRSRWSAELAAVLMVVVLSGVGLLWARYILVVAGLDSALISVGASEPEWVWLG